MFAASIERHRQGRLLRVRVFTGATARQDRNVHVKAKPSGHALTLARLDELIATGFPVEAIVHFPGGTMRKVLRADWRNGIRKGYGIAV